MVLISDVHCGLRLLDSSVLHIWCIYFNDNAVWLLRVTVRIGFSVRCHTEGEVTSELPGLGHWEPTREVRDKC